MWALFLGVFCLSWAIKRQLLGGVGTAPRLRPLLRAGAPVLAAGRGTLPRVHPAREEALPGDRGPGEGDHADVEDVLAVPEGDNRARVCLEFVVRPGGASYAKDDAAR